MNQLLSSGNKISSFRGNSYSDSSLTFLTFKKDFQIGPGTDHICNASTRETEAGLGV